MDNQTESQVNSLNANSSNANPKVNSLNANSSNANSLNANSSNANSSNANSFTFELCTFTTILNEKEKNLQTMEKIIKEKVSHKICDIYIFHELCIEGYGCDIKKVSEYENGNSFQFLSAIAKKYNIAIVYGFAEKDNQNKYYCSLMFIGKDGNKLCCYRKAHIYAIKSKFGFFETLFTPGNSIGPVINYLNLNIGFLICYDAEIPECSRVLTLMGADVLITIAVYPNDLIFKKIMSTRSKENIIYSIVVSNTSFICLPTGKLMDGDQHFTLLKDDVEYFSKKRKEKLLLRRPELYQILVE